MSFLKICDVLLVLWNVPAYLQAFSITTLCGTIIEKGVQLGNQNVMLSGYPVLPVVLFLKCPLLCPLGSRVTCNLLCAHGAHALVVILIHLNMGSGCAHTKIDIWNNYKLGSPKLITVTQINTSIGTSLSIIWLLCS